MSESATLPVPRFYEMERYGDLHLAYLLLLAIAAPEDTAVRAAIQSQYNRMNGAIAMRDISSIMAPFAPDYTANDGGRIETRKQYEQNWKLLLARMRGSGTVGVSIDKLVVHGKQAVATTHVKASFRIADAPARAGAKAAEHTAVLDVHERDTWVDTKGTWLLKHTDVLPGSKRTLDGKPLPPLAGPVPHPARKKRL